MDKFRELLTRLQYENVSNVLCVFDTPNGEYSLYIDGVRGEITNALANAMLKEEAAALVIMEAVIKYIGLQVKYSIK